jgi:putative hydrolase of the HAD superfamily
MVRAITFDAAGTLIRVAEPVGETYARSFRRAGIDVVAADAEARFRAAFVTAPPLAFPGLSGEALDHAERGWWRRIVAAAMTEDARPAGLEAAFTELYEAFARGRAWRAADDARETLEALERRGILLGVVSNFDSRLSRVLAELDLARFFRAIVPSSVAGAAKPDPAIFRLALARLGVEPAEAAHVGDDERCDRDGASAAGLRAWLLDPSRPSGERSIRTLGEILSRT